MPSSPFHHFARRTVPVVAALLLASPSPATGQVETASGSGWVPGWTLPLPGLGGDVEDRWRLAQLLGHRGATGFLLRTPSLVATALEDPAELEGLRVLSPELHAVWNSDLPFSLNDGALWAGRGWNTRFTTGVWWQRGRIRLVVAPQLIHQQNRPFQAIPFDNRAVSDDERRSRWADPFHPPPESIDQPLRFGDASATYVDPGQSSLTVDLDRVEVGLSTENAWWGPGVRNAIVLSDQAPGVPRLFVRTRRPVVTPIGDVEARWFVGRLDESDFFDLDPANDHRSLSALAATLRLAVVPSLTLGVARAVFAPLDEGEWAVTGAFDVFRNVGRPNSAPPSAEVAPGPDQVFSFFGRWLLAPAGFEFYWEWARFEQPSSVGDFFEHPQHSQGYTLGLQWADGDPDPGTIRLQAEASFLEPSATFRSKPVYSSYASRSVPQGYTHAGQVLGASIGPAASSQWLAGDYLRSRWRIGTFLGRIRWENQVLFLDIVPSPKREDVTVFGGLRGSVELHGTRIAAEYISGIRLNYLFQSTEADPLAGTTDGVDIGNRTLSVTLTIPTRRHNDD